MSSLPATTKFNARIPKQTFYEHIEITPALKRSFIDEIKAIYWRNKIASTTMNIAQGSVVTEIEVIEIQLNQPALNPDVLKQIDRTIPYHILFVLAYDHRQQAWIGYQNRYYYHTEWTDSLELEPQGLSTDAIYENYVRQINPLLDRTKSLQEAIELEGKKKKLQKQIEALQAKIRREKQFNKQVELNAQIKKLKKEMEQL